MTSCCQCLPNGDGEYIIEHGIPLHSLLTTTTSETYKRDIITQGSTHSDSHFILYPQSKQDISQAQYEQRSKGKERERVEGRPLPRAGTSAHSPDCTHMLLINNDYIVPHPSPERHRACRHRKVRQALRGRCLRMCRLRHPAVQEHHKVQERLRMACVLRR